MAAEDDLSVFLSYSRRDTDQVAALQAQLVTAPFDVLIDVEDIRPGEPWRNRLLGMIDAAHVFLFALTATSIASRVCMWELEQARLQKKRIIIVVMGDHDREKVPKWVRALNYISMRSPAEVATNAGRLHEGIRVAPRWLRYHTQLLLRARAWQVGSERIEELLTGSVLKEAEQFTLHPPVDAPEVGELVRQFVMASGERERAEQAAALRAAEARAERERKLRKDAESRALAARSQILAPQRHDLAGLVAVEAWRRAPSQLARIALCQRAMSHPRLMQMLAPVGSFTRPGAKYHMDDGAAFSPDGSYLAHVHGLDRDGIRIWKLGARPEHIGDTPPIGPGYAIVSVGFSGRDEKLVLLTDKGTVLGVDKAEPEKPFAMLFDMNLPESAKAFAVSPDHNRAFINSTGMLHVIDLESGRQSFQARSRFKSISRAFWLSDGALLITGRVADKAGSTVQQPLCMLLDPAANRVLREDPGHAAPLAERNGYFRTVKGAYDVQCHMGFNDYAPTPRFRNYAQPEVFAVHSDGEEIAFVEKAQFHVARAAPGALPTYQPVHASVAPDPHGWYIDCVQPAPRDGKAGYVSLAPDGSVALWSKDKRNPLSRHLLAPEAFKFEKETSLVRQVAYQPDLARIARLNRDGRLVIWERARHRSSLVKAPLIAAIHFSGKQLFGALEDGRVALLKSATRPVENVRFDARIPPKGAEGGLIGRSLDGALSIFDLDQGALRKLGDWDALALDEDADLDALDYCARTQRLAVPRSSGQVDIFVSEAGRLQHIRTLETVMIIEAAALAQNGTRLLMAGCEAFEIWDMETFEKLAEYGTGSGLGSIWRAAIDPNAHFIAAKGDYGGTITLYDASDGARIVSIPPLGAHDAGIGMTFAPDGSELAVDDAAGGLFLLDFRPESWVDRVTRMAGRDFTPTERRVILGTDDGAEDPAAPDRWRGADGRARLGI